METSTAVGDPSSWTTVNAPIDCDAVQVINSGDDTMYVRGGAGQRQIPIPVGNERTFTGAFSRHSQRTRFLAGQPAFDFKPATGTGPADMVWL